MSEYIYKKLKIDKTFKNLIPPLSAKEYSQLEKNLLSEGCREAICVWNDTIIDGHNRYELCLKHELPFKTQNIILHSRNEAIAWICANQIGRRNITEETRRYLIGKRYEIEKTIGSPNQNGINQHSQKKEVRPTLWVEPTLNTSNCKTAKILGAEYKLSHATIEKYGAYSRAIDELTKKGDDLTPKILSGQTKISQENVIGLSKLPAPEAKQLSKQLIQNDRDFVGYTTSRKKIESHPNPIIVPEVTVKDMPAFDPDAEISSLTLTIPSWISSIERTKASADLELVTDKAKNRLTRVLADLIKTANSMLDAVKEV